MATLINPEYALKLYVHTAMTLGATIGGLFTRYEVAKIIGLTVLIEGVGLELLSNCIAYRDCIEFAAMKKGHSPLKDRLLIMNQNPDLNAAAQVMLVGINYCVDGVVLAFAARVPFSKFSCQISAKQLAPWMLASSLIIFVVAHWRARAAQAALSPSNLSLIEQMKHEDVPKQLQPAWEACVVRDRVTHFGQGLSGLLLTIGIITARLGLVQNLLTKSRV